MRKGKPYWYAPNSLADCRPPRIPCEIREKRVYNTRGEDKTDCFVIGAQQALKICRANGCRFAVLKANSPSCGPDEIYDGTFTHTKIKGSGIFASMLKEEGIELISELDEMKGLENYL